MTDTSDPSFTGQNSDTVSGLYDFLYRENSSSQGRWISPDPSGLSAADPNNPQSWNRYAYVANNPLSNIDRMGLDDSSIDGCANKNVDCVPGILDGISVLASDPAPTHVPFDPQNTANVNGGEGAIVPQQLFGLLFPNGIQSAPNNPTQQQTNGCSATILSAVNNTFGTNATTNDVQGDPFPNGNTTNLNIELNGLSSAQFNSIQTGRYPLHPWTYLIGYGPTLHVTGQTLFDPSPATFQNSNTGGATSVLFTAHIDSDYAYNPIGALLHGIDVLLTKLGLTHHNPCP